MKRIKLDAEYEYYALWDLEEAEYLEGSDLPLTQSLVDRLSKWQADYDATLDLEEPYNTGFKTLEARKAFEQEGLEIAEQMQSELGDGYEIYYRNERVKIPVQT